MGALRRNSARAHDHGRVARRRARHDHGERAGRGLLDRRGRAVERDGVLARDVAEVRARDGREPARHHGAG